MASCGLVEACAAPGACLPSLGAAPVYAATALAPKVPKTLRSQVAGAIKEHPGAYQGKFWRLNEDEPR